MFSEFSTEALKGMTNLRHFANDPFLTETHSGLMQIEITMVDGV